MTSPPKGQPDRLPRGTLDREAVVAAALDLADREGLKAVTMARVAGALGASAMALYRYVHDKQELLEAVIELALAEVPAIAQDRRPWRARLEEFAWESRRAALRHPALVEVVASQNARLYGAAATTIGLDCIGVLRGAGFDNETSIRGYMALRNHLLGALLWEISRFRQGSAEFHRQEIEAFVRHRTPADSPLWHFAEVVADDPKAQFAFGISRLLDGFEAELRRSKRRRR